MFLRFFDLPLKPLHHDEGVNALILGGLADPPHQYSLRSLQLPRADSVLSDLAERRAVRSDDRGASHRHGSGRPRRSALAPLAASYIGRDGALAAAALLALSPRRCISPATSFTKCCSSRHVGDGRLRGPGARPPSRLVASGAAAAAGLVFATKETAIISAVVIVAAAFGSGVAATDPSHRVVGARARCRSKSGGCVGGSGGHGRRPVTASIRVVFLAVALVFYTSLFTNWRGAIDAVKTFAFWTRTGTAAHTQPWHTYLEWLAIEESPLLLLGATGAGIALWRAGTGSRSSPRCGRSAR